MSLKPPIDPTGELENVSFSSRAALSDPEGGAFFQREAYGSREQAVALASVLGPDSDRTIEVMGKTDPTQTTERGAVAYYADARAQAPKVDSTSTTFTSTTCTFGIAVSLTDVVEGMIIDVDVDGETSETKTSAYITAVNGQVVTIAGWRRSNIATSTPPNGTRTRINRFNKIWARNANVYLNGSDRRMAASIDELGVFTDNAVTEASDTTADGVWIGSKRAEGKYIWGHDVVVLTGYGTVANHARGAWKYGYASTIDGVGDTAAAHFVAHKQIGTGYPAVSFYDDDSQVTEVSFKARRRTSTDKVFASRLLADTTPRFFIDAYGNLTYSADGSTPNDGTKGILGVYSDGNLKATGGLYATTFLVSKQSLAGEVTIGLDANGSIDIGKASGSAQTPFIDWHYSDGIISAQDFNVRAINESNGLLVFRAKHSTPGASSAALTLGQNSAGNPVLGFFGTTTSGKPSAYTQTYATADKTLSAYTSDPESGAYTGIATGVGGSPYAQLTDLNSLRVAYENLRAFTEDAAQMLNSVVDDLQGMGLAG